MLGPFTAANCFWTLEKAGYTGGSYAGYRPAEVVITEDNREVVTCVAPAAGVSQYPSSEAPADGDTVAVEIAIWDTRTDRSATHAFCRSTNTVKFTYARPSGPRLEVTSMSITSHTKESVCYTYAVTNVGDQAPPADYDPKKIVLNARIKALDENGETIKEYAAGGIRGDLLLPENPSKLAPGASFVKTNTCASNKVEQEVYEAGVVSGNLHLYMRMTGPEYATHNSEVTIIGPTTTVATTTTPAPTTVTSTSAITTSTTITANTNSNPSRCGGGKSAECVGDVGETWSLTATARLPAGADFKNVNNPDAVYTVATCSAECDADPDCVGFIETVDFNGACMLVTSAWTSMTDLSGKDESLRWNWWAKPKPASPSPPPTSDNATAVQRCPHKPNRDSGRCGPTYENLACPGRQSPYCNEMNGYCGGTDGHRDAQESTEYDFCDGSDAGNDVDGDGTDNDVYGTDNDGGGSEGGATTTVGGKVVGDPNGQNQDSTNGKNNSGSSTAAIGGTGNEGTEGSDENGEGDDDDALETLAVVNKSSLIIGIVFGVVVLIAASVGLTVCLQKRKNGAEAHPVPVQAVLTNFKARDRTESEGGPAKAVGVGSVDNPAYYTAPTSGAGAGGSENTYGEAVIGENEPTVPNRRPKPPERSAANQPRPISFVNPAYYTMPVGAAGDIAGPEQADYEYGDVPEANRTRLGSIVNESYEVPVAGCGAAGDGMEDYEYPDDVAVDPITGNAVMPPPCSDAVDDGGAGVVYAVYAGGASNPGDENYQAPVGDYAEPNGEYGRPSSAYGIPEEDAYYAEPAVSPPKPAPRPNLAPATTTDDAGVAVVAGVRRDSSDFAAASDEVGRPEQAVGWQDSDTAYLHTRTASKRPIVYAVPMDSTV